jgi:hypothetical protein
VGAAFVCAGRLICDRSGGSGAAILFPIALRAEAVRTVPSIEVPS